MAAIKAKHIDNWRGLFAGLLYGAMLYILYLSLSLLDPWGYMSPMIQAGVYGLLALLMMIVIARGLMTKNALSLQASLKGAFLAMILLSVAGILAGSDARRLLEVAVKPRAIFDYPVAEIIVRVTPPAYMGRQEFTELLTGDAEQFARMKPIPEGSEILIRVNNIAHAPTFFAGQNKVEFLSGEDSGFVAHFTLKDQTVWQIRQGSLKIAEWPIVIMADDAPNIERADFRQMLTGDGLFGLSLHLSDDFGIQEVVFGVVAPGSDTDVLLERTRLDVSDLGEFSGEVYINLASSDFAGSTVDLIVEVTDQAGQKQQKILAGISLPAKEFSNPFARKIIEIRSRVKTEPEIRKKLAREIMALGLAPDDGQTPSIYYMALRSAYWRLNKPENEDELNSARDILWDLAAQMEDGDGGQFTSDILALLAALKLTIFQGKEVDRIRKQLQEIDKVIILFLSGQKDSLPGKYDFKNVDVKELRRIYGKILTHGHYKRFDQAIELISYLEHGFIYRDGDILSGQGYEHFQILSQAQDTLNIIRKTQRQAMSFVLKNAVNLELASLEIRNHDEKAEITTDLPKKSFGGDVNKWMAIQKKLAVNISDLGRILSKSGINTTQITLQVKDLVRDAVQGMEAGNMEAAAQYQIEILSLLKRLKNIMDLKMQYRPEPGSSS